MTRGGEGDSSLVQLDCASYTYPSSGDPAPALRPTTLKISVGEAVRVTGRNGTGKTTLLKLLAGTLEPTTGSRTQRRGLRAVYLDQRASDFLAEGLTVREQLFVGLSPSLGILTSVRRRGLDQELTQELSAYEIGIEKKLSAFVAELSGGQRQIIALLSTLFTGAELLLLDEFKAAMDPVSARTSDRMIEKRLSEGGIGIVLVDHTFDGYLHVEQEINLV